MHLIRVEKEDERRFYKIEITNNNWSVRELEHQINTSLYNRLSISKDKAAVKTLSEKAQIILNAKDLIKAKIYI